MISSKIREFFSTPRPAQASLPSQGQGSTRLSCQLLIKPPNLLMAHFPNASFTPLSFDPTGTVFCYCAGTDTVFHLYSRIDKITGEQDLQMIVVEAFSYPQLRRFFRVDAEVFLKCRPLRAAAAAPAEAKRTRVNLSAVGLRFQTIQPFNQGEQVDIEMQLPGEPPELIHCLGRVMRSGSGKDNRSREVAIDLVEIPVEAQDKIIKFCLIEQRRQIRLKVQVLDPGVI
ncbi:MAG: PilZ domain-containing protein [Desulfobacterales bacterium]|nr:PilZ domain-containing protein [Desulfobacterales bacterium]